MPNGVPKTGHVGRLPGHRNLPGELNQGALFCVLVVQNSGVSGLCLIPKASLYPTGMVLAEVRGETLRHTLLETNDFKLHSAKK